MSSRASVGGGERIRLFCALKLRDDVLDRLVAWQRAHLERVRVVPRGNLHVTLAFLGWTDRSRLDEIVSELRGAAADAAPIRVEPVRYRETRSVGMLVLSDDGGAATALAADVQRRLAALGVYEPEAREWLPHLTVARFRERPRLRPPVPDLGPVVLSEAAAYLSVLRPSGAEYVVLESVPIGGN